MSKTADVATTETPISLSVERARKFLRLLADDPFIALVVTPPGEVRIFSKGIESDHLARIKEALEQIQQED